MSRWTIVVALSMGFGCTTHFNAREPSGEDDDRAARDQALHDLQGLRDRMCACGGRACADTVLHELGELDDYNRKTQFTDDERAQAKTITDEISRCMERATRLTP